MGCATSKKEPVCRNCCAPRAQMPVRSYSMHVHHPPQREGDSYHVVALTSSTLGSLNLNSTDKNRRKNEEREEEVEQRPWTKRNDENRDEEFSIGLIEAKKWSNMIDEKIPKILPKTPIATPPGEPETINTWELMEGLEDISPTRNTHRFRSFSFHVAANPIPSPESPDHVPKSKPPVWLDLVDSESDSNSFPNSNSNSNSNAGSIASEFDPDVISEFRKALEDLPPANPFHLKTFGSQKEAAEGGKLRGKERAVLYFTSLRGVRKTYEDCCHVRVILKGTGVRVDERDVSMHSGFKEELKELLGDGFNRGGLPRVFVGKRYIGGAEEIRRLHEEGQLEKVLACCEVVEDGGCGGGGGGGVCEACGDIRFVPCETCSGSCKIFYEDEYEEEEEEEEECEESECGFQRCPDCNENGIIRCPICCD